MQIKKVRGVLFTGILLLSLLQGCSTANKEDGYDLDSVEKELVYTETFEQFDSQYMAGPTAEGENLYASFVPKNGFLPFHELSTHKHLRYGINQGANGQYNCWNGAVFVSNWNTYTALAGASASSWYSFINQASVYNTASVSGVGKNAAFSGSNFAVVTGTRKDNGKGCARIYFKEENAGMRFLSMKVCNAATTAGVALYGNGSDPSLVESEGYFTLIVRGGKQGKLVTDSNNKPIEDRLLLIDFREGKNTLISNWSNFELTQLSEYDLDFIEFDFEGSDVGEYGLNTPAYACLDNLKYAFVE